MVGMTRLEPYIFGAVCENERTAYFLRNVCKSGVDIRSLQERVQPVGDVLCDGLTLPYIL